MINLAFIIAPVNEFSSEKPFTNERQNIFHAEFAKVGSKLGFNVFFPSHKDYTGKNVNKAWFFDPEDSKWKKIGETKVDCIYRYFFSRKREDKFIELITKNNIPTTNNTNVEKFCWDKWKTYNTLKEFCIKTFLVNNAEELKKAAEEIKTDKIILKRRFGIKGINIKLVDKNNLPDEVEENTLAQEFVDSSKGIEVLGINSKHDLRLLLVNGEIDHAYVRVPKKDSVFANCALGADKIFVKNEDLVKLHTRIFEIVGAVDAYLGEYKPSVYTVDFIFDKDQTPYLLELNSQPGAFYYDDHEDIRVKYFQNIFKAIKDSLEK